MVQIGLIWHVLEIAHTFHTGHKGLKNGLHREPRRAWNSQANCHAKASAYVRIQEHSQLMLVGFPRIPQSDDSGCGSQGSLTGFIIVLMTCQNLLLRLKHHLAISLDICSFRGVTSEPAELQELHKDAAIGILSKWNQIELREFRAEIQHL